MIDYMKNYLPIPQQQEWHWGASGTKEEMNLTGSCSDVEASTWWLCGMDSTTIHKLGFYVFIILKATRTFT
jgi:hypothetical protein